MWSGPGDVEWTWLVWRGMDDVVCTDLGGVEWTEWCWSFVCGSEQLLYQAEGRK